MALADQIRRAPTNGDGLHTDNVPQFPPDIQAPNRCKRAMGHFALALSATAKAALLHPNCHKHDECLAQWTATDITLLDNSGSTNVVVGQELSDSSFAMKTANKSVHSLRRVLAVRSTAAFN